MGDECLYDSHIITTSIPLYGSEGNHLFVKNLKKPLYTKCFENLSNYLFAANDSKYVQTENQSGMLFTGMSEQKNSIFNWIYFNVNIRVFDYTVTT